MNFFTHENLTKFEFKNGKDIQSILQREARSQGFDIFSRNNVMDLHPVFYCSYGGRKCKNGSNKTNCPFYLRFKPKKPQNLEEGFVFSKGNLNHEGHTLDPTLYTRYSFEENQKEIIHNLHCAGCSNSIIQNYILNIGGPFLSSLTIEKITKKAQIEDFSSQSQDLIDYMEHNNGAAYPYDIESDNRVQRIAVFTISSREMENLNRYMDVIMIDPIKLNSDSNWQSIPITLVNENRVPVSGGVLFTSLVNEDVMKWMLDILLYENQGIGRIRTIITDDNPAFTSAFKIIKNQELETRKDFSINHVVCASQKMKDIKAQLKKQGLKESDEIIYKMHVNNVCFSESRIVFDNSLNELNNLSPDFKQYMEKNIIPYFGQFSRSQLSDVFCLGINNITMAQKLGTFIRNNIGFDVLSLSATREKIDSIMNLYYCTLFYSGIVQPLVFEADQRIILAPNISALLKEEVEMSKSIVFDGSSDGIFSYDYNNSRLRYRTSNDFCECGLHVFLGIPCRHIIALCNFEESPLPIDLINKRWRTENGIFSDCNFSDDPQTVISNMPKGIAQFENYDAWLNADQRNRALTFRIQVKCIEIYASKSDETMHQIIESLNQLKSEILDNDSSHIEPISQPSVSDSNMYYGKKKNKSKKSKQKEKIEDMTCMICLSNHPTEKCELYPALIEIRNQNSQNNNNLKSCSLCFSSEHTIDTCCFRNTIK